jgi:hypothetical protein
MAQELDRNVAYQEGRVGRVVPRDGHQVGTRNVVTIQHFDQERAPEVDVDASSAVLVVAGKGGGKVWNHAWSSGGVVMGSG